MAEQKIPVEDVREGDRIDVAALLDDPAVRPWVWEPFGHSDDRLADAMETARMVAESEYGVADDPEPDGAGCVTLGTTIINFTVPAGHSVPVDRD